MPFRKNGKFLCDPEAIDLLRDVIRRVHQLPVCRWYIGRKYCPLDFSGRANTLRYRNANGNYNFGERND